MLKGKHMSYEDVRAAIQASDAELDRGLKDRRILNINGRNFLLLMSSACVFIHPSQVYCGLSLRCT